MADSSKKLVCNVREDGYLLCGDAIYSSIQINRYDGMKAETTVATARREKLSGRAADWEVITTLLSSETKTTVLKTIRHMKHPAAAKDVASFQVMQLSQVSNLLSELEKDKLIERLNTKRQYGSLYRITPFGEQSLVWHDRIQRQRAKKGK